MSSEELLELLRSADRRQLERLERSVGVPGGFFRRFDQAKLRDAAPWVRREIERVLNPF